MSRPVELAAWLQGAADAKRATGDDHSADRLEAAAIIVREAKGREQSARNGALEDAAILCDRYAAAYDDGGALAAAQGIRAMMDAE